MERCDRKTANGRQCWLKPEHEGKHMVMPVDFAQKDTSEIARVVSRIRDARPDVPFRVLSPMILTEAVRA